MRLRTYLVRRAIHTVVTLLVVLILLFMIFRLMPGDPARFFIAPGQPPQVRDEICVSFGLCKWVSAPGNGYENQIRVGAFGPYKVSVWVNDTARNMANYSFVYNKLPGIRDWRSVPMILNVTFSVNGGPERPSVPDALKDATVNLTAQVL